MNLNAQLTPGWEWVKTLSATHGIHGHDIAVDTNGNGSDYVTGGFRVTVDFDPGDEVYNLISEAGRNNFISKMDTAGNFIWAKLLITSQVKA